MATYIFRSFLVLFLFLTPLKVFAFEGGDLAFEDVSLNDEAQQVENLASEIYNEVELDALQSRNYLADPSTAKKRHSYSKRYMKKDQIERRESGKVHIERGNIVQPINSIFFRTDIGIGLLYFRGVRGNLAGVPANLFDPESGNAPYRGSLMYNRTPLYESMLGYRFKTYFRGTFSYLHQGDITVQTKLVNAVPTTLTNLSANQLTANLSLDAILLKCYVDAPWSFFWKNVMANLYLGTGIGVGWQTWRSIQMNLVSVDNSYTSIPYPLREQISTNAIWVADAGLRVQGSSESSFFSLLAGCKFNLWGQARNIGKLEDQGTTKLGIFKPFKIKSVYQWAPYLGVQWEFPNHVRSSSKYIQNTELSNLLTQMNVGVGILYFKKVRGNLISLPNQNGTTNQGWQTARVGSNIQYNRTPLFEYLMQHRLNDYFQIGGSYQYQAGITVQTEAVTTGASADFIADTAQLISYLNLNALMVKGYMKSPLLLSNTKFDVLTYLGFGFGVGRQTWNRTTVQRSGFNDTEFKGGFQPIRQKISASAVINLDFGVQATSKNPQTYFSILGGCKFNYWGQARSMGKQSQQGRYSLGLQTPVTIKRVYQWAPYLGVQWSFPNNNYSKQPYYLDGRSPNTWKPYIVPIGLIQKNKAVIVQMNIGVGFLYFNRIRGNLSPIVSHSPSVSRDVQIKGKLTYNRTPLFDYLLGYRFNNWLKVALSYQHQGNVTVQTKVLHSNNLEGRIANSYTQLSSDLTLDAVMAKCYFELPKALVLKNYVYSPYFALGIGPAWQTWKRVIINQPLTYDATFCSFETALRQKTSASTAFMFDFGCRMQTPYVSTGFSVIWGLKFNLWGQARNLGKYTNQLNPRNGLVHPFAIKTV